MSEEPCERQPGMYSIYFIYHAQLWVLGDMSPLGQATNALTKHIHCMYGYKNSFIVIHWCQCGGSGPDPRPEDNISSGSFILEETGNGSRSTAADKQTAHESAGVSRPDFSLLDGNKRSASLGPCTSESVVFKFILQDRGSSCCLSLCGPGLLPAFLSSVSATGGGQ